MSGDKGKSHPIFDVLYELRKAYLELGFVEVMNPLLIERNEIYKQFGAEANVILDRCYFLAGLPRPDIGLSGDIRGSLRRFGLNEDDLRKLQRVLRDYKRGKIHSDDLTQEIAEKLDMDDDTVMLMLDSFPELRSLSPEPSSMTLRSHMTAGWFLTLAEVRDKMPLPIKLFSIDRVFRREQREDASHLRSHHSASCVLVDEDASTRTGEDIAKSLLERFGVGNIEFRKKPISSRYYRANTETEVCIAGEEVADFGVYSDEALERYDVPYAVMNLGLGVERLAMVLHGESDIRALAYPQFYGEWKLSDADIANLIGIDKKPSTAKGYEVLSSIVRICELYGNEPSPCSFKAWEGELYERNIVVYVSEKESNTNLCGPAFLNEVMVRDGNILAIPRKDGVSTHIRFLDAFAALAAYEIERAAKKGENCDIRVRVVRSSGDINLRIDPVASRYVMSHGKEIDIRGPVFILVEMRIEI